MKAFVTGGTGFIGSHLVDQLLDSPEYSEVRCLVRSNEKWLTGKPIIKVSGDLNDLKALSEGLDDADVLFHIAAIVKAPDENTFLQANVESTENLIRLAQKKNVKNLVILSSLAAVGPSNGAPVDETAPLNPVSMYGRSKKEMEKRVRNADRKTESIKIIRPPAVYGPREDQIFSFFKSCSKGICPIIGNGKRPRVSMVYVSDLVNGIIKAAEKTDPGVFTYFISGPDTYNWDQIRSVTGKVLGRRTIPLKISPKIVKKAAGIFEDVASFFGKYPVVNREKANELVLEWTCSNEKAQKELNYKPEVSLAEGISRTIHWYKIHNWL
ncbi:NAD-dependent epimerase/dehydratase family protein [Balneola sp. MJW-20]|uniref:NAD-dependent epimerase/dehydratase family protein n=1 Tax=Gracilimonas aurantiaca TaxID=3234185 RepID=UPI003466D758